ncbi:PEP/pyruvate-binding domain-containing protein [Nonomuraea zeae]|uniref:Pyruvate, water dikinase n=1 Tax=Nonomuraea zeae TaxID=1642303 RepID=A0A5S4GNU8_9ACTN|nr:PEP/pyruvate-binding domain-containing protein [Nonomuraea zeae]TMR34231.1 pyruvate, water dikinase [Nonomuraea zeae]
MNVIGLADVDAGMIELVGGKAAGLGEMIRAGERVPDGFCLTTEAFRAGGIPDREVADAYERLGKGPVAVRSSATAEDLPEASFAGQQDTFLEVAGTDELLEAIRKCWESLNTERAIAYRAAHHIDESAIAMAVVVQRMVEPQAAGVLFTANPITGTRGEGVVDATPGLGTAVVDGSTDTDHYVLDGTRHDHGCLSQAQLDELGAAGRRLEEHFGSPQDIEFAFDHDGTLWLLQSRAITTLFPLPPGRGLPQPRVYLEIGHMQGLLHPATPMGMSALLLVTEQWLESMRMRNVQDKVKQMMVDVDGHFYVDLTPFARNKKIRQRLPAGMEIYGPRVSTALAKVLEDPRFAPVPGRPYRLSTVTKVATRLGPTIATGIVGALIRPEAARTRTFGLIDLARRTSTPPAGDLTPVQRLRFAEEVQRPLFAKELNQAMGPLFAGIMCRQIPVGLLKGVATQEEVESTTRGLPYNVTTDMDLELWQVAVNARPHRDLFLNTPAEELAGRYRAGELPDIGLGAFLDKYGHRGVAEIDLGVPHWADDPAPVFSTIANYLRVTDPEQAPDRRFERARREAEAKIDELVRRARRRRPIRAALAGFFMRRARQLAGLRELPKFVWLIPLVEIRRQMLIIGAALVERGLLDEAGDIMFLYVSEVQQALDGTDLRGLVAERRQSYRREMRRRNVPGLLLSDGTDVEAALPAPPATEGTLTGLAGAPGQVTGRARVVLSPANAHIEPGDILIAPTTDPGWTPLFMTAGGLVTETGSPMAHGPTVAREYGIPAVICVRDATREIRTGQLITVDGAAGTVRLEEEPATP